MSTQSPPASGVPRGWSVDHQNPSEFVVRCTSCGRIDIQEDRGRAHRRADNHALTCSQTGVTPVRRPEPARGSTDDSDPDPHLVEAADAGVNHGGLDVLHADLRERELVVRYESTASRAGQQEIVGDVTAMVSADDQPFPNRGFILRLDDGARRQVDVLDAEVLCAHNVGAWRVIGALDAVAPAITADNPPVVTVDGGEA
jgi:hypothetical protein